MAEIINRVEQSGIITLDLEYFLPKEEMVVFDLKECLWEGLILKEKDFREFLETLDWRVYQNKHVAVTCSVDSIIQPWAYMLIASKLVPYAKTLVYGDINELRRTLILNQINALDFSSFDDKRVVIKGCADIPNSEMLFFTLVPLLQPHVKSLMYGEPCSTVPVYKKK
jgi:hypothetical protein